MNNITKSWKTSILGIIFIISGLLYIFLNASPDYIIMCILIGAGIGFIFSPDKVFNLLNKESDKL